MLTSERVKLLYGPYHPPRFRLGGFLRCTVRGKVTVRRISAGRIAWPQTLLYNRPAFIICGDLVRALRRESPLAICHWWGVSPGTVSRWRRAIGVPEFNDGTRKLRSRCSVQAPLRLQQWETARQKTNLPEVNARRAASNCGRQPSALVLEDLARGRKKVQSPAAKKKRRATPERLRLQGPLWDQQWTADQIDLLGTLPDEEVAARIGKTVKAVGLKRCRLRIATAVDRRRRTTPTASSR
jgi:hypothetical protein